MYQPTPEFKQSTLAELNNSVAVVPQRLKGRPVGRYRRTGSTHTAKGGIRVCAATAGRRSAAVVIRAIERQGHGLGTRCNPESSLDGLLYCRRRAAEHAGR